MAESLDDCTACIRAGMLLFQSLPLSQAGDAPHVGQGGLAQLVPPGAGIPDRENIEEVSCWM